MSRYEFVADVWRSTGEAAWYFVTLPHDVADEIDEITTDSRRGFGSIRSAENIDSGSPIAVLLALVDASSDPSGSVNPA